MSTGEHCEFVKLETDAWFYGLGRDEDHLTWYGPFDDKEQAQQDLQHYHANPGGWQIHEYTKEHPCPDYKFTDIFRQCWQRS